MPSFKFTLDKDDDGHTRLQGFEAHYPDGIGDLKVERDGSKVSITWSGEDTTVKSVLNYIRNRYGDLGDMFPGIS